MNWNSAVRNNDICISCLQLKWQCKCVIFINSKQKTKWLVAILYTFVIISLTFSCERNSQFLLLWFQFVLYYYQQNFPPVMVLILLCLLPGNNMVSTFKVYTSCQFSQWNLWVKKKKDFSDLSNLFILFIIQDILHLSFWSFLMLSIIQFIIQKGLAHISLLNAY